MRYHLHQTLRCIGVVSLITLAGISLGVTRSFSSAAASEQDSPSVMMLSVTVQDPTQLNEDGQQTDSPSWTREIFRQYLLMVAREEFGLITRDAMLDEPVNVSSGDCFHLSIQHWRKSDVEIVLRRGGEILLETFVKGSDCHSLAKQRRLSERAVELKPKLVDALRNAGLTHSPLATHGPEQLPEEVETLLRRMNHVSQFAAVRRLHSLLREQGESPAILSGLSRGYAHLSQLTIPLVDMRCRAFGARALLYAARLCEKDWDSPSGFWNRGHVFLWLGFPRGVQGELDGARKRAKEDDIEPPWVTLQRLYVEYRFEELEQLAYDESYADRESAALLWMLAARMTGSPVYAVEIGQHVRDLLPHSERVITLFSPRASVALPPGLSLKGPAIQLTNLHQHLRDVADIPASVVGHLDELGPDLPQAEEVEDQFLDIEWLRVLPELFAVEGDLDVAEPSWHVMAANIRGWNTRHLFARVAFLRESRGVSCGDFVDETLEKLDDDRYVDLYRALGTPKGIWEDELSFITEQMVTPEINFRSVGYRAASGLAKKAATADGLVGDIAARAFEDMAKYEESLRKTLGYQNGERYLKWVQWAQQVSEHAPVLHSELIRLDWANVADKADEWEARFPNCPDIQKALGHSRKLFGDIDRAIDHYERYLAMIPETRGYVGLAEARYIKDKSDTWLSVLEEAMECDDHPMEHASAAVHGAATLMRDGRFEDALPWARRAADFYSYAGIVCLIECQTALGEFDEAEELARERAGHYRNDLWYEWCVCNGQGDLEGAWEARLNKLSDNGMQDAYQGNIAHAIHHLITGNTTAAVDELVEVEIYLEGDVAVRYRVWAAVLSAVLFDELGDADRRDSTLQHILSILPDDELQVTEQTSRLIQLLLLDAGAGDLSPEEIEDLVNNDAELDYDVENSAALVLGRYLWNHDLTDRAIEVWKHAARAPGGWNRMLACSWLRTAGVEPIHLEDREFEYMFVRKQQTSEEGDEE